MAHRNWAYRRWRSDMDIVEAARHARASWRYGEVRLEVGRNLGCVREKGGGVGWPELPRLFVGDREVVASNEGSLRAERVGRERGKREEMLALITAWSRG